MRTVDGFVAAAGPAGAPAHAAGVILAADEKLPVRPLFLEMALEAEDGIPLREEPCIHGTVGLVAGGATFPDGFVLKGERAALRDMAASAGILLGGQGRAATRDRLAFVRVVAVSAAHLAFGYWVMVWKSEPSLDVEVALEANLRRFVGIDDRSPGATGLVMRAARAVAGLTTNIHGVRALGLQSSMRGGVEVSRDLLVALLAGL